MVHVSRSRHALPRRLAGLALLLLSACRPASIWSDAPADLRHLLEAEDYDGAYALTESKLQEHFGDPLPAIRLHDRAGSPVSLDDFHGERIALFIAGGPCPMTRQWMRDLSDADWTIPGYRLVTLVTLFDIPDHTFGMQGFRGTTLQYDSPFPSYLTYVRFYPLMLYVDENGELSGYQRFGEPIVDSD